MTMTLIQKRIVKRAAKESPRFGQQTIYVNADYTRSLTLEDAIESAKTSGFLVPHFYAVSETGQITFHEPFVSLGEFKEGWEAKKQPIGG